MAKCIEKQAHTCDLHDVARRARKPLVSCLMVARPNAKRFDLFRQSVDCYLRQRYPHRELVVLLNRLSHSELERASKYLSSLSEPSIRVEKVSGNPSLGKMRNLATAEARGEFLCLWDDDDLSHPMRITAQLASLEGRRNLVSYLQQAFHLFLEQKLLYWTDWSVLASHDVPRGIPGTILFSRDTKASFRESGPYSQTSEDDFFFRKIMKEHPDRIGYVTGPIPLYTYVFHGGNQFDQKHHFQVAQGLALDSAKLRGRKAVILRALRECPLPLESLRVYSREKKMYELAAIKPRSL